VESRILRFIYTENADMPHVKTWDEFVTRAEAMFRASPSKTRYCVKYRHCDGKLVLKVTDDKEVNIHNAHFWLRLKFPFH